MKRILYALIAAGIFFLAGCFDIKDEIFLEEKGNGTFQSTIDVSGMNDIVNMLKTMMPDSIKQSEEGQKLDGDFLQDSIMSMWRDLETIPGISQVTREKKGETTYSIRFRFADIKALNAAMASRGKQDSGKTAPRSDFFSYAKGTFSCHDTTMTAFGDAMKGFDNEAESSDSAAMNMAMLKAFMGDMKYTHIYHLPGKVQSVSNPQARISEDGKTVTLEIDLTASDKSQSLQNTIKFRQ